MKAVDIGKDLKKLLINHLGSEIEKIILFGSRARGEAKRYSDYDFLIILKNDYDWRKRNEILSICNEIDLKYNLLTNIKVISLNELNTFKGKLPFISMALNEGVNI